MGPTVPGTTPACKPITATLYISFLFLVIPCCWICSGPRGHAGDHEVLTATSTTSCGRPCHRDTPHSFLTVIILPFLFGVNKRRHERGWRGVFTSRVKPAPSNAATPSGNISRVMSSQHPSNAATPSGSIHESCRASTLQISNVATPSDEMEMV
jgi:hypothetical protein